MKATFEGRIYVRPLYRGVCILPSGSFDAGDDLDFEEWVSDSLGMGQSGDRYARITVTVELEDEPPAPTAPGSADGE